MLEALQIRQTLSLLVCRVQGLHYLARLRQTRIEGLEAKFTAVVVL
jgi:hypothetical protein